MRQITQQAAQAFKNGTRFSKDNTTVSMDDNVVRMYLHGNLIAEWELNKTLRVTLAGWGTPTTRERVNGLLTELGIDAGYHQCKHTQRWTDSSGEREVSASDWIEVENTSA